MPAVLEKALIRNGVGAATAPVLADVIFLGLSIALSIVFAPDVPKPDDGRTPLQQPVPSRVRIIGKRRNAGAKMLFHSYRGSTFYGVNAICEGAAKEFTRYWLHDDQVSITSHVVNGLASSGPNRYGDGKVQIYTRLGAIPETSYTSDVPGMPTDLTSDIWSDDHRGDGIVSTCIRAADAGQNDQAQRFPFGIPNLSVEVVATKVFDPRDDTQDIADRSTWGFGGNDNPILQAMWYLTAPIEEGGIGLDIEECFGNVLDAVGQQADVCDELVPKKVGQEKRYLSGVLYKFTDNPGDVLAAILGACDGFVAEAGDGSLVLKAGKWDDDDFDVVIGDRHIISLETRQFRPDEDEVTGVIVKYNSLDHGHTLIDAPVWPRDAYQGGEDHRIRSIEIAYCPSPYQAQRLSKRVAIYEMAPISGTAVLNMYGVLLLDRRGVSINCSDHPALATCKARLTRVEPDLVNGTITIDFTVFDPAACDAWNPSTEEGPIQPVVTVPIDDSDSMPTSLIAVATLIGGSTYVDLQFDPGSEPGSEYLGEWRVADTGGGVAGPWNVQLFRSFDKEEPNRWIVTFSGVAIDALEVRLIPGQGPTSAVASVDTTSPGPGMVNNLATTLVGADVHVAWTSPKSGSTFDHARVYRSLHGAGFGLATDISGPVAGSANSAMSFDDVAPATGSYDYWVTAETAGDLASLVRGPSNEVVP